MTNYIEELKERRNRVHNHGTCKCCDNWTKIRDIELAEVDRRARADWLRSEIEKSEGELDRIKKYQIMVGEHKYYCECKAGNDYLDKFLQVLRDDSEPLTSIITRYKEELKVLESK